MCIIINLLKKLYNYHNLYGYRIIIAITKYQNSKGASSWEDVSNKYLSARGLQATSRQNIWSGRKL